jgi:hypothetical protein
MSLFFKFIPQQRIKLAKYRFFKELEHVLRKFPKCRIKILLDFNANEDGEDIFK